MSEFIPATPDGESESRQTWDRIIHCLYVLSELSNAIDLFEELEALRDETEEDALMVIFNYWINISTLEGESNDLQWVTDLLIENGLIESRRELEQ